MTGEKKATAHYEGKQWGISMQPCNIVRWEITGGEEGKRALNRKVKQVAVLLSAEETAGVKQSVMQPSARETKRTMMVTVPVSAMGNNGTK